MVAIVNSGIRLNTCEKGTTFHIERFTDAQIAARLMSMGLLPGAEIRIIRTSPFGGACYIKANNQYLALRKEEAACIVLK